MSTLSRYNQFPAFADSLLNGFFANPIYGSPVISRYHKADNTVPATNIKQSETAFYLDVAAPGLKKEYFSVNVENKTLTVAYKQEEQADQGGVTYAHQEFGYASFQRTFRLPKNVNADQIQATYTDGILRIEIPKVEEKKAESREISIA